MSKVTHVNARSADARKLAKWLEKHVVVDEGFSVRHPSAHRRLREWRHGGRADYFTVDAWMTRYGGAYNLSDIPKVVWSLEPVREAEWPVGQGKHLDEVPDKPCQECGEPILKREGQHASKYLERKYCSKKCRSAARVPKVPPRFCARCGGSIPRFRRDGTALAVDRYMAQRYCGNTCQYALKEAA